MWKYIKAAFNARPWGIFVPPNWVGLGIMGLLGFVNPGFWLIGAGAEAGYLFLTATSKRFQRLVDGGDLLEAKKAGEQKVSDLLSKLDARDQARYQALVARCAEIVRNQARNGEADAAHIAENLNRLLWIYLRLLTAGESMAQLVAAAAERSGRDTLESRAAALERKLQGDRLSDELRKSYEGQLEILRTRQTNQREAAEKIEYVRSELSRIEEQVELAREQSLMSQQPAAVSHQVDWINESLNATHRWMKDHQEIVGAVEEELTPPPRALSVETERNTA